MRSSVWKRRHTLPKVTFSPEVTVFIWNTRASGDRNKEQYVSLSAGKANTCRILPRVARKWRSPLAEAQWNSDEVCSQRAYPICQPCSVLQSFSKTILMGISRKEGYNSIVSYGFSYFCISVIESKGTCLCAGSLQDDGIVTCPFHPCKEFSSVLCRSENSWRPVAKNSQLGSCNDEFQALLLLRASPLRGTKFKQDSLHVRKISLEIQP